MLLFLGGTVEGATPGDPNATAEVVAGGSIEHLYETAIAALAANEPARARQLLERIVAARPEFAGAWLDLALAAYRSGDTPAGLKYLDHLQTHFALPPALFIQVDYWQQSWQKLANLPPPAEAWHGELFLGYGHDRNANAGLSNNMLALTLPSGSLTLPVDPAFLPRADSFALLGLTAWGAAIPFAAGRLTPIVVVRSKQFSNEGDFSNADLQAGAVYLQPAAREGSWRLASFIQHYRLGNEFLYNALRLNVQRSYSWKSCQTGIGGELETRQNARWAAINGRTVWIHSALDCPLSGRASLNISLRIGHEAPQTERPGGINKQAELNIQYIRPLAANRRLEISWQINDMIDAEGYSPLLSDNAPRHLLRQRLGLAVRQPIAADWEAVFSLELQRQQANLPLFNRNGQLFMLGLSRHF